MVFFRFPFQSGTQCVSFDCDSVSSEKIHRYIASYLGSTDFSLVYNGKTLPQEESVSRDANVLVTFSLPGGKGGFGSMLRAIGAQIEKTTNREACRDLSGRRLRDINEEQRLKKWISKESEREAEKIQRRKARIERLKSKPKHNFNDFEYEKKLSEAPDRIDEAISAAMEKKKRPSPEASCSAAAPPKKKHLWLGEDISSSSDSEPEGGDSREATNSDSCDASEKPGCSGWSDPQHTSIMQGGEASSSSNSSDMKPLAEVANSSSNELHSNVDMEKDAEVELLPDANPGATSSSTEKLKEVSPSDLPPNAAENEEVDLLCFESPSQLEGLGLERLKGALVERGLKCGGSLTDRALRLWAVRGLLPQHYPRNLLAKKK